MLGGKREKIIIKKGGNWMSKKVFYGIVASLFVLLAVSPAMAEEAAASLELKLAAFGMLKYAAIAAGFGLGFAAGLCGIGQGLSVKSAMEGIARNPEASGKITVGMIIGLAMIEALTIYSLVVALIILFADPFKAVHIILG